MSSSKVARGPVIVSTNTGWEDSFPESNNALRNFRTKFFGVIEAASSGMEQSGRFDMQTAIQNRLSGGGGPAFHHVLPSSSMNVVLVLDSGPSVPDDQLTVAKQCCASMFEQLHKNRFLGLTVVMAPLEQAAPHVSEAITQARSSKNLLLVLTQGDSDPDAIKECIGAAKKAARGFLTPFGFYIGGARTDSMHNAFGMGYKVNPDVKQGFKMMADFILQHAIRYF